RGRWSITSWVLANQCVNARPLPPLICYVKFTCKLCLIPVIFTRMVIRRFEAILLGIALLLCGAVSHSSWESPGHAWLRPEINLAPQHPWIALTFDDGPHVVMTERLLDVLKDKGVPATFFVVGKMAVRHPGIVQEIARQGHEVA